MGGVLKIIDFGLARVLPNDKSYIGKNSVMDPDPFFFYPDPDSDFFLFKLVESNQ